MSIIETRKVSDLSKLYSCTLEEIKTELINTRNKWSSKKTSLGKLYKLYLDIGEDDTLTQIAIDHVNNPNKFEKSLLLHQLHFLPIDPRRSQVNGKRTVELLKHGYTNEFIRYRYAHWPYFELLLLCLKHNTTCYFEAVSLHAGEKLTDFILNHYRKTILELLRERIFELDSPLRRLKSKRKRISDFLRFDFSKYYYVEKNPLIGGKLIQLNETKNRIINSSTQINNKDEETPELKITRQQILYLFALLERHKIIKEIIPTKVGRILHELTGFSEQTMRADWKKETLETFETKKNLKNLDNLLKPIIGWIEAKQNEEL